MTGARLAILVLCASHAVARADDRDPAAQARRAFHDVRYQDALRLVDDAWRSGHAGPGELRELFAIAGQAAGSIGDEDAARLWFSRWLSIEPDAHLPPGTSPKLTPLFAQARDGLAGQALVARATRTHGAIDVTIASDPLSLVAAVRSGDTRVEITAGHATLPVHGTDPIDLLDLHGNVLATIAVASAPLPPRAPSQPVLARWSTWAIVSGGLAAVGGGSLWVALDARSSSRDLDADSTHHQFGEASTLDTRFERAQWVARFAFAASAGAAIASVLLWRHHEQLVVTPTGGGASVTWSASF